MFCNNCSTQLPDGAKFCHNCGRATINNLPAIQQERQQFIQDLRQIDENNRLHSMATWALWAAILGFGPLSIVGPIVALVLSGKVLEKQPEHKIATIARNLAFFSIVFTVFVIAIALVIAGAMSNRHH